MNELGRLFRMVAVLAVIAMGLAIATALQARSGPSVPSAPEVGASSN